MKKKINIAMIGHGFMGRAHSNAWLIVNKFFDTEYEPVLKIIAGIPPALNQFADRWEYEEFTYDWYKAINRKDIDIVDIVTPTYLHCEIAVAAAELGKHIICEKPCALTFSDAKKMANAANHANVIHYLNHNYRRVPAIAFAKKLIEAGRLGDIYHWRGAYLQDWILDPKFPLTWHLEREKAGGGPLFDLGSHAVDLAMYLIGNPVSISAKLKTFIHERPLIDSIAIDDKKNGKVTVDDAASMMLEFENGAIGSIDTSRFATGRKNYNYFEIYGSIGSIIFNLERLNELDFLDFSNPGEQGYKKIIVTETVHPYARAWWGPGHVLGYENTFVHAFSDFLNAISSGSKIYPNFDDGAKIIQVLEAAYLSDKQSRKVQIKEII